MRFLFLLFIIISCKSNDILKYNVSINKAKSAIIKQDYESAILNFNNAFKRIQKPFANDEKLYTWVLSKSKFSKKLIKYQNLQSKSNIKVKVFQDQLIKIFQDDQNIRNQASNYLGDHLAIDSVDRSNMHALIKLCNSANGFSEASFGVQIDSTETLWHIAMILSNHFSTNTDAMIFYKYMEDQFSKGNIPIQVYGYFLDINYSNSKKKRGINTQSTYMCKIGENYFNPLINYNKLHQIDSVRYKNGMDSFRSTQKLYIIDKFCQLEKGIFLVPNTFYNGYSEFDFPKSDLDSFKEKLDLKPEIEKSCSK